MGKTRLSCSLRENGRSMSQKYLLMAWISLSLSLLFYRHSLGVWTECFLYRYEKQKARSCEAYAFVSDLLCSVSVSHLHTTGAVRVVVICGI